MVQYRVTAPLISLRRLVHRAGYNIGQVALFTFNTSRSNASQLYQSILLCINLELFLLLTIKVATEKESGIP